MLKLVDRIILYSGIVLVSASILMILFLFGTTFGTVFVGLMGLLLISISILNKLAYIEKYRPYILVIRRVGLFLLAIFLITLFIIEGLIFYSAQSDEEKATEYVIILGAGLRGTEPSLILKNRLETGLSYLNKYPNSKVIVSGGQGKGEDITEAEAMSRYLLSRGIEQDRIIMEDKSTSTKENIENSKAILDNLGGANNEVTIVTSNFHMYRAKYFSRSYGLQPYGLSAKTPTYVLLNYTLREYFAVVKAFVVHN